MTKIGTRQFIELPSGKQIAEMLQTLYERAYSFKMRRENGWFFYVPKFIKPYLSEELLSGPNGFLESQKLMETGKLFYRGVEILDGYEMAIVLMHESALLYPEDQLVFKIDIQQPAPQTFEEVTRPLIKWLCEHHHPHVTVIVTPTDAQLFKGVQSTGRIMDYVKD